MSRSPGSSRKPMRADGVAPLDHVAAPHGGARGSPSQRKSNPHALNGAETRAAVVAPLRLSVQQARRLHLAAQGLLTAPRRRARKSDVLDAIRAMRLLQIDTIHVVA